MFVEHSNQSIRKECFAFEEITELSNAKYLACECTALKTVYCSKNKCSFYKSKEQSIADASRCHERATQKGKRNEKDEYTDLQGKTSKL